MEPWNSERIDPRQRRKGRPSVLYHASPWRLKIGTNLRPRWSPYQFMYKVWMSSSHRSAVDVGKSIIETLREGDYGFCGTACHNSVKPTPQDIHGVWIYRVKPTGPIEGSEGEWESSFPVRILEIASTIGEPERNNLVLPEVVRSEEKLAGIYIENVILYIPKFIIDLFQISDDIEEGMLILAKEGYFDDQADIIGKVPSKLPEEKLTRAFKKWHKEMIREHAARFKSMRRKEHHKLFPDPRYKRNKAWKKEVDEELSE